MVITVNSCEKCYLLKIAVNVLSTEDICKYALLKIAVNKLSVEDIKEFTIYRR